MNDREYIEEIEIEEEHDIVYLYRLMEAMKVDIQKKRTDLFKNLVVSFRKSYPLSNFINNDEGPIFDFTELLNRKEIECDESDENWSMTEDSKILKSYCPICGCELKNPFTIKDFYSNSEEISEYFNQKIVYLKSINPNINKNTPRQISFNYISCPSCMRNIVENYNNKGKPLLNSNLLNLYLEIGKYLDLEYDDKLNFQTKTRCLYPVDRIYLRSTKQNDKVFYFNLFMMCDYARYKFEEYWTKLGKSELDYDNDKMIVFTNLSTDMFNPSKFKDFREFEGWLKKEAEEDFLNDNFIIDQFKNFKYTILDKNSIHDKNFEVQCEKYPSCKNCSGKLKIPTLESLFYSISLRKTEDSCVAKQWEDKNIEIKSKVEIQNNEEKPKKYLEKEEISIEEIQSNNIIKEKEEIKMPNDEAGILSPEEEVKLNPLQEGNKDENIQKEKAEEVSISPENIEEKKEEAISEENKEESDIVFSNESVSINENNDIQEKEKKEEDLGTIPIQEKEESLIEPILTEEESKSEKVEMSFEDKLGTNETIEEIQSLPEENKEESENQIFEKAMDTSEKSLIEDMAQMEESSIPSYLEENDKLINDAINKNSEMSLIDRLYNSIMVVNKPSQEDFLKTYEQYVNSIENEQERENLKRIPISEKMAKGMELYVDYQIQDIYRDCEYSGKSILNKYEGISYEDLQEYMFDKTMRREIQESRIENDLQTRVKIESAGFDYNQTLDMEDDINKSNAFLNKQKEKEKRDLTKSENKCNVKAVFRTKDIKRNNPFVMQMALRDSYQKSPFRVVIDMVLKMDGYKAGAPIVTIEKNSLFVPIIDFADVGIRFVCIDTTDTKYWTFQENPVKMVNRIPFPNEQFAYNHSLNFLYSNECLTNPQQVAFSIFKLVNRQFFPPEKIVRLTGRGYPIAYTTERQALIDFEKDHSIFAGLGRAKQKSVTLIAFVDDADENKEYQSRKRMAERMTRGWKYNHDDYFNTYKNLLEDYQMCYILSAHYVVDEERNIVNGIEEKYIHYTITQYTENIYCIVEDGLPAIVTAIIKEHYKEYPNMPYSITYEFDRTALVSPSIRKLINNTENIFNIDPTSIGQSIVDTNTTWVISESRFQKNTNGPVDDRARQDYRYFKADEVTLRNFLRDKIRADENLSNIERLLASIGYYQYPEPKSQNFELTTYALDLLEHSSLFSYMFPIEIAKLGQDNAFDSYSNVYQEMLTAQFMMKNNLNVPGSNELFQFIDRGASLVGQIVNWWKGNQQQ